MVRDNWEDKYQNWRREREEKAKRNSNEEVAKRKAQIEMLKRQEEVQNEQVEEVQKMSIFDMADIMDSRKSILIYIIAIIIVGLLLYFILR